MTATDAPDATGHITITPETFVRVEFDREQIREVVAEVASLLGVPNPIHVEVDEDTPLARMWASVDGTSSDATITLTVESGAIEDSQRIRQFGPERARESLGRMLLRARDRLRGDFDLPADGDLGNEDHTAWNTYASGRLARLGIPVNQQRWRYDYRNRFGFSDDTDAAFDRLWAADDLSWDQVRNP
jgi:hypothetical protein